MEFIIFIIFMICKHAWNIEAIKPLSYAKKKKNKNLAMMESHQLWPWTENGQEVKVDVASAYVEKEGTCRRKFTEPKLSPHHTDKALALVNESPVSTS